MMRTNECSLDVGGFVFVLHIVESRQNCRFQRFFVIGYKNVVNALFFLLKGSASVFTLRVVESVLQKSLLLANYQTIRCDLNTSHLTKACIYL